MASLLDLLGKRFSDPEVAKRLAEFPGLRPEEGDAASAREGVRYLRSTSDGLLVKMSDDGEILAFFMMSDGKDGCAEFRGELPRPLHFASEPADAIRAFGPPALRQPPRTYGGVPLGELLRFDFPTHSLHIQFRPDDDGIDLVTAMIARQVPGRSVAPK